MKIPSVIKDMSNNIYKKFGNDVGLLLIWTTIAAWIASSTAQCIGILSNSKYSSKDKTFMLLQEAGDAAINIGAFFALTYPLKRFALKLGKTGKVIPNILKQEIKRHGDLDKIGKLDFDIGKLSYIKDREIEKHYKSFMNFMGTTATVTGGIVSSNIITPILRNQFASKEHNKVLEKSGYNKKQKLQSIIIRQSSLFDNMRTGRI